MITFHFITDKQKRKTVRLWVKTSLATNIIRTLVTSWAAADGWSTIVRCFWTTMLVRFVAHKALFACGHFKVAKMLFTELNLNFKKGAQSTRTGYM